jgi:hypothetical protein
VRVLALDEEDVGLLAGLEDAELGVDGAAGGHDPVGAGLGPFMQGSRSSSGTTLTSAELVGVGVVGEDERLVDALEGRTVVRPEEVLREG